MKATSGLHPDEFVQRMENHWINELNNVPNKALKESWHQIAETFEHHIQNHDDPEKARKWTVLSPPTGAGKVRINCDLWSHALKQNQRGSSSHAGCYTIN